MNKVIENRIADARERATCQSSFGPCANEPCEACKNYAGRSTERYLLEELEKSKRMLTYLGYTVTEPTE